MHLFFRSNQLVKKPYKLFKGYACTNNSINIQRILNIYDLNESKRLLSTISSNMNYSILKNFNENRIENYPLLVRRIENQSNFVINRTISTTIKRFEKEPLKPSSKVEVTVQELKKSTQESSTNTITGAATTTTDTPVKVVEKKSIKQKIIDELVHYYHGFRLLFIDAKISTLLLWRVLNGNTLTRREHRLLTRTVGDMFRLVPFSVFIVVPFLEFALPFFIKFFPGMLPSTFQTAKDKEDKLKNNLKVKLEMAKFLQETLDDMAVQHKDRRSTKAKEFAEWFHKVRTSGEEVRNDEIMKYAKLFEDEITLDSLNRSQLIALCRVLEVQTLGTNNFLRFQLRMKLRSLAADDKMIQKEGIDSLNLSEVQQACRARGMRAYGLSESRLRQQLSQWLDLSLNEKVPPSLLLLSRALMLPETIPTSDQLKATISALPETIVTQTKAAIGEKEGKIDNKIRCEIIKEEERKCREDRLEQNEEKKKEEIERAQIKDKEILIDKAPVICAEDTQQFQSEPIVCDNNANKNKKEEHLQSEDFEIIECAIDKVSQEKHCVVEKGEIEELKEQMADYKEDVEDLNKATASQPIVEIKETKAAKRLYKSVNKMINKLDNLLIDLENKEKQLKEDFQVKATDKTKEEIMKIDDIMTAIKSIKNIPDQSKINQMSRVLKKMDDDDDGAIKIEDALKVIEIIGKENVKLNDKQVDELIELLNKEEILEVEGKIEKALSKDPIIDNTSSPPIAKSGNTETVQNKHSIQDPNLKPKFEAKSTITTTPPATSIDKTKSQDKML